MGGGGQPTIHYKIINMQMRKTDVHFRTSCRDLAMANETWMLYVKIVITIVRYFWKRFML